MESFRFRPGEMKTKMNDGSCGYKQSSSMKVISFILFFKLFFSVTFHQILLHFFSLQFFVIADCHQANKPDMTST